MSKLRGIAKSSINNIYMLELNKSATMASINCHSVGKIIKFYPDTQTADIQMQQIIQNEDELLTPTILVNVPIFIYGGVNSHITLPNLEGSTCILMFMDRNIDAFLETGEMYVPSTNRLHNITDCIALCTFKTNADPISDYDNNALTLKNNNSIIKLYKDKIKIANASQNLLTLVNEFVDTCSNITITGQTSDGKSVTGGLTQDSKDALANIKTKFQELLQ